MKRLRSFLGIIFLISTICFSYSKITYEFINAKAVRVLDGDTIAVKIGNDNFRVRLFCIDTMESRNNLKLKRDLIKMQKEGFKIDRLKLLNLGMEAKNFLSGVLKEGTQITLKLNTKKKRDKYGRLLAEVFYNNQNLNIIIVKKGLGKVYFVGYIPENIKANYIIAEQEARKTRSGIWRYLSQ